MLGLVVLGARLSGGRFGGAWLSGARHGRRRGGRLGRSWGSRRSRIADNVRPQARVGLLGCVTRVRDSGRPARRGSHDPLAARVSELLAIGLAISVCVSLAWERFLQSEC